MTEINYVNLDVKIIDWLYAVEKERLFLYTLRFWGEACKVN